MRGGLIAIAAIVIALVATWWLRRPDPIASSEDETTTTGNDNTSESSGRRTTWLAQSKARGRRVAGTVLLDGVPVPGAIVRLVSRQSAAGLQPEPRVVTDDSGRFELGEQIASRFTVVAEKAKLTASYLAIDLRDPSPQPPPDQLRLVLHACDAAVYGTIRDVSGGAIAKARVSLAKAGGGVEADDDGRYELCVPVSGSGVEVVADGYAKASVSIAAYGRVRRDFALVPEVIVTGRVVRADNRSAVAGALLELRPDAMARGEQPPILYASSDDEGRFRIDAATPGRYTLSAKAERLSTREDIDVVAEIGNQDPVTCELVASLTISGKVVERGTQAPISGAAVTLYGRGATRWTQLDAISQDDGSFELEHAFSGEYRGHVEPYDSESERKIVVDKTDVRGLVFEVERLASISGRVTYNGKPVDDAAVNTDAGGNARTDATGQFVLRGLRGGKLSLYAESKRLGAFMRGNPIELGKTENMTGVELVLDLSGSIAGTVVDQNGAPVAGAVINFSLLRGRDFGQATTAEDGTFKAGALSGGGDYTYQVGSQDRAMKFPAADGKRFPPIAVRDGQTHITGVRIAVRYERLSISGRVVNKQGAPVPDVYVQVEPKGQSAWAAPSTRTDVGGAFTVGDLRAGEYTVRASSARSSQSVPNVAAGRRDVVLELADPGEIAGKLEGFAAGVNVFAFKDSERHRATVTGDSFQIRNVSPGNYRVIAVAQGTRADADAVVTSGKTTTVVLRNPGSGVVSGLVVDDSGRPLPDVHCGADSADTKTDASGRFRVSTTVGTRTVGCYAKGLQSDDQTITVVANETVEVRITMRAVAPPPRGNAGFATEIQLGEILVASIVAGGPAERAGLAVGDVLLELDGVKFGPYYDPVPQIQQEGPGAVVKLTIERDDKPRTITLTLDP